MKKIILILLLTVSASLIVRFLLLYEMKYSNTERIKYEKYIINQFPVISTKRLDSSNIIPSE